MIVAQRKGKGGKVNLGDPGFRSAMGGFAAKFLHLNHSCRFGSFVEPGVGRSSSSENTGTARPDVARQDLTLLSFGARSTLYVALMLFAVACSSDNKFDKAINIFFSDIASSTVSKNYDLKDVIPETWESVCLCYIPYASVPRIEEIFRGNIVGDYQIVGDSNWVMIGINAKSEITQVVLNLEVSKYLSDHFQGTAAAKTCVSRERAVLMAVADNGKRHLRFGNVGGK